MSKRQVPGTWKLTASMVITKLYSLVIGLMYSIIKISLSSTNWLKMCSIHVNCFISTKNVCKRLTCVYTGQWRGGVKWVWVIISWMKQMKTGLFGMLWHLYWLLKVQLVSILLFCALPIWRVVWNHFYKHHGRITLTFKYSDLKLKAHTFV